MSRRALQPPDLPADRRERQVEIIKANDPCAATSVRPLGTRASRGPVGDAAQALSRSALGRRPDAQPLALPALSAPRGASVSGSPVDPADATRPPPQPSDDPSPSRDDSSPSRSDSSSSRQELARLRQLVAEVVAQLIEERQRAMLGARDEVVELALAIARRIVRREVQLDREVVVRVLSEALGRLHGVEHVRVRLHPRDLRMAQQASAPARQPLADVGRLELVADAEVTPGGCVVETPSGSIDATIETQFAQMEAVLAGASGAVPSPGEV